MKRSIVSALLLLGGLSGTATLANEVSQRDPESEAASKVLKSQLVVSDSLPEAEQLDRLLQAARRAADILGDDSERARTLRDAAQRAAAVADNPDQALAALRAVVERIELDLRFLPRMEAELPAGFPPPSPVGEVVVKEYPAYRMAVTAMDGGAFWSLFSHIKKNEITMTAPVEMRYGEAGDDSEAASMAFLYRQPELGEVGSDGRVDVVDAPPITAVSTGVRGERTQESIGAARERLVRWLDANGHRYAAAGPMRVMGYNSPFMPKAWQFFEVEIPIAAAER